MNKLILTLAVAACGMLSAQSSKGVVRFQLAQPAMVGNVELPVGTCTVALMNTGSGNSALLFRCVSGAQAMVLANSVSEAVFEGHKPVGVVLTHHGDAYRVDQVWLSSNGGGYKIIPSHVE
jgi:hypothetical protein